jgi:predicted MPP superfamily phosphohydrolase
MGFISTIFLTLIVGDLMWWWRAHRWLRPLPHHGLWQVALAAFCGGQLTGLGLILLGRSYWPGADLLLPGPVLVVIYLWHLAVLVPLLVVWLAVNIGRGATALASSLVRIKRRPEPVSEGLSRREFLGAAAALAPAVLTLGGSVAAHAQLARFRVREIELPLSSLPAALEGLRIAHVTDIHVGRFTQGAVLEEIVRTTNNLRADLVLLTGDLINYALSDLPVALEVVNSLRGTHGVFTCEGNHDLIENGRTFESATRAAGVNLLRNESTVLEIRGARLQLLGLRWGGLQAGGSRAKQHGDAAIAASMAELLTQRRADAFPLLLAHHPHAFDFAEGIPLTLAGHTHGGQLMFSERTGFGPWLFRYWSGLYEKAGRALVVSNGVGNWFPLRTNAPAEIIQLTLRARP